MAIGLTRLGHTAAWAGAVGDDEAGELVLRTLRAEGVDVSGATRDAGAPASPRPSARPPGTPACGPSNWPGSTARRSASTSTAAVRTGRDTGRHRRVRAGQAAARRRGDQGGTGAVGGGARDRGSLSGFGGVRCAPKGRGELRDQPRHSRRRATAPRGTSRGALGRGPEAGAVVPGRGAG
ncbi:PfkB family carbohydrate kinase [Streptomyces sp. NPDC086554]|uniref:PfkB family carbohydrate kinase n=1 Tax=Streptomyces sp. NPDC086554 TaxID=3154864 RepID=UPI00344AE7DC